MPWGRAAAFLAVVVIAVAVVAPRDGGAEGVSTQVAEAFVQSVGDRAFRILEHCDSEGGDFEEEALKELIRSGFNIDLIGRFVLGSFARKVTRAELAEYQTLYREFFVDSYSQQLCAFRGDEITVLGSEPVGTRDAMVEIRISRDGKARKAAWRVRAKDGDYKIIDLTFEGVSMALSQREEFAAITASRGMTGLLEVIRAKLDAARSGALDVPGAATTAARN